MSRHGSIRWMVVVALTLSLAAPDGAEAKRGKKRKRGKKAKVSAKAKAKEAKAKKAKAKAKGTARGGDGLSGDAAKFDRMAKKAYVKKAYDDAIAAFEVAYKADAKPKFLFNIGRCYEKKGDLPRAMQWVTKYRDIADNDDDRHQADDLLALLEVKLRKTRSEVAIATKPAEGIVRLKGEAESADGMAPFRRWMAFGIYDVEVSLAGHDTVKRTVAVKAGTPVDITIELRKTPPPPVAVAPKPAPEGDAREGGGPKPEPKPEPKAKSEADPASKAHKSARADAKADSPDKPKQPAATATSEGGGGWAPVALLGGAGAAVVGGLVFGTLSSQSVAERDALKDSTTTFTKVEELDAAAKRHALVSNVLLGVGAAAGLTGGLLLLLDGGGETSSTLALTPASPAGGLGLTLSGAL